MHTKTLNVVSALGFALGVTALADDAWAQRVPRAESTALGAEAGIFVPRDDRLDKALAVGAFYEYYVDPRVSLRVAFGHTDPDFKREAGDSLRQIRLGLDVLYNWEGGAVHPFVGAGVGAYFLRLKDNGSSIGEGKTKLGVNVGGGLEFFTGPTVSIKGEILYHAVGDEFGLDPSGLTLTIGLKKYF